MGSRVLLVLALKAPGGVVLEVDSNLRDTEELVTTGFLSLFCALQIHCSPLPSRMLEKDQILAIKMAFNTWLGMMMGSGCGVPAPSAALRRF